MKEEFLLFWNGPFSQWYKSHMEIRGVVYNCCEQYMMAGKASLFKDHEALEKVMSESDPRAQKQIGKEVKGFDKDVWESVARDIVFKANVAKFTFNEEIRKYLFESFPKTIVEASPYDPIWGIGLGEKDPKALDRSQWQGKNWLGEVLMEVREALLVDYVLGPVHVRDGSVDVLEQEAQGGLWQNP